MLLIYLQQYTILNSYYKKKINLIIEQPVFVHWNRYFTNIGDFV